MNFRFPLSGALLLPSLLTLLAAAPPNDHFSSAQALIGTNLTVAATNLEATREVGEPNHGANVGGRSVWWQWTAPGAGSVIIHTTGSTFDTLLGVYTGSSFTTLVAVASNDDNGSSKTSLVGFNLTAGTTYRIAVDGYNGASGQIQLHLSYRTTPIQLPANDAFADRTPLTGVSIQVASANFFARKERTEPNHAEEIGGASVWWTWTAPASGLVEITTEGSSFDTLLAVYTGSDLASLIVVASNDDVSTNQVTSAVSFNAVAQTAYQIAVDGFDGEPGDIQLQITMKDLVWMQAPQRLANGSLKLNLTAMPGRQYGFDASTNLTGWSRLTTLPNPTGVLEFIDPDAASHPRRFYRVVQLP